MEKYLNKGIKEIIEELDDKIDSIGYNSFAYRYTPFSVVFMEEFEDYHLQISYDFCENIPVLVYSIILENRSEESKEFKIGKRTASDRFKSLFGRTLLEYISKNTIPTKEFLTDCIIVYLSLFLCADLATS